MDNLELYKRMLSANKYKLTPQRLNILDLLMTHQDEHYTAEQIYEQLKSSEIGLATVYRTLEVFTKLGIVKKLNLIRDDYVRYDLIDVAGDHEHFHHHLVCSGCGEIIEIEDDLVENIDAIVERKYNFNILNHELIIYGICKSCR